MRAVPVTNSSSCSTAARTYHRPVDIPECPFLTVQDLAICLVLFPVNPTEDVSHRNLMTLDHILPLCNTVYFSACWFLVQRKPAPYITDIYRFTISFGSLLLQPVLTQPKASLDSLAICILQNELFALFYRKCTVVLTPIILKWHSTRNIWRYWGLIEFIMEFDALGPGHHQMGLYNHGIG